MRREQITIGHKRIGYLTSEPAADQSNPTHGRKQPPQTLLFLHAFPLNADMWHPQIGVVPAGWRLIAPDYRGFGQSSPSDSPRTTMNDLAGDAIDLLDHLEITSAVVAGCSMGGYVAFELFESAPTYAKGLVLIDTRAGADTDEGKASRRKMLEMVDQGGSEAVANEMTPKLLGETTKHERPDLVKHVHHMIRCSDPAAIKMAISAMMDRKDMTTLLDDIHVPTLIVAGVEDTLIPLPAIQQMHDGIKGSKLEMIPFAGHLPTLEQTTPFDAALYLFLQQF
jgi:pimeloyl-ACP methyl ester carboxylesterase